VIAAGTEVLRAGLAPDAALQDVYAARADKTIFLEADRSLPYSRVVDLMDACRAAGVERIGIATKKGPADR
jgi:biopolymer transport protein ExbD